MFHPGDIDEGPVPDPRACRAANHRIECGNRSDYCHTCHVTIPRIGYGGAVLPLEYPALDDVTGWTL